MSYSFQFTVATKAEAKARAAAEMDNVVAQQPHHAKDKAAAVAAANTFIDMLADDDSKDIQVSMHGSISFNWDTQTQQEANVDLTGASIGVSVYHTVKVVAG